MLTQKQKVEELLQKLREMRYELRRQGVTLYHHKEYQELCKEYAREKRKLGEMMIEQMIELSNEPILLEHAKTLWGEKYVKDNMTFYLDQNMRDYYVYSDEMSLPILIGSDEY